MLRILNRYSHGYTFFPVACALREKGFFGLFHDGKRYSIEELAGDSGAHTGYLKHGLEMLAVMNWIETAEGKYALTDKASEARYLQEWLYPLYGYGFIEAVTGKEAAAVFGKGLDIVTRGWGCESPLSEMLDGVVMLPLMFGLVRGNLIEAVKENDHSCLPLVEKIRNVFVAKKWAGEESGEFKLSGIGKFMLGRCMVAGVTASYRPMLSHIPELLFGDPETVVLADVGNEKHVDRELNVQSSGFQHEKYFKEIEQAIISIFSDPPVEDQPDYVSDMGCGDGTLLKRIYEVIRDKTERGRFLTGCPVTMIGMDFNTRALEETESNLQGIPHKLLFGDVGDPFRIPDDLKKIGVTEAGRVMHVRSFLDHNRKYVAPKDASGVEKWSRLPFESAGIGPGGTFVSPAEIMQNLSEHLRRWSSILGRFGLLALEVHYQTRWAKKEFFDTAEGFHFDVLHAFSRQYLCEPEYFLAAMAENGLFPRRLCRGYPKGFPYTRITLGYFEKKPYRVEFAFTKRMDALRDLKGGAGLEIGAYKGMLDRAPELSFVLCGERGEVLSALLCSYGNEPESGKRGVILEYALGEGKELVRLFRFLRHYLTFKDGTGTLSGIVFPEAESFLAEGDVSKNHRGNLATGEKFTLIVDN